MKLVHFLPLVLAVGCATYEPAPPPDASEPRRARIPKLSGSLQIDGRLDEPVWRRAAVLKPFIPNRGEGADSEGTEVRIWYDDTALHLGWICIDRDIQATFTARDSKFWEEEVAEFFITPDKLDQYFELQWNPLGGVFDAIIRNQLGPDGKSRKFTGDWDYTAQGMRSAVRVEGTVANSADTDRSWTVEVSVPFADLGVSAPKPGAVWRGNFYRFSRGSNKPETQLSWSPTRLPSFHQPARFGYLEFGR
ncbi:MAG: carbohydrate-binding family 9-like protein [Verrucomicrobiota bacterium]